MSVTLLTGSAGFIASHVIPLLDGEVRGIDSLDPRVHKGKKPAHWQHTWIHNDYCLTPPQLLSNVDTVIHLAAQVSVSDSADDPSRYIIENSQGTAEFLLNLPPSVTRLVVASSMSVYGEGGELVKETDAVCPQSVYGLTKYDQERLCLIWGQQHNVPVAALRFFNVYGPGQSLTNPYTGVLANFATRLLADEQPTIYDDGEQTRDFIHVSDVARCVALAARSTAVGVFNVCTGQPTSILKAAMYLAAALGKDIQPDITYQHRKGDIRHCTGSPVKAASELGFIATVRFEDGIRSYGEHLLRV